MIDAFPTPSADAVPWVTVDQMREVDRLMVEDLGISLVRMMENAGRSLAVAARAMLEGGVAGRRLTVLAGPGGNGGGGLVAARHLANAGAEVRVHLSLHEDAVTGVPAEQLAILRAMGVAVTGRPITAAVLRPAELVIDAVLGYGQRGAPRGPSAALVGATAGRRVLALDVPSGLDPDSGAMYEPGVRAEVTMTLAAPTHGLGAPRAAPAVGRLLVADISVPPALWSRVGAGPCAGAGLFDRGPIVAPATPPRIADSPASPRVPLSA
ncbi:MAG: NAD(P)H-hydrate epimerase [Thermoleophilia bacterium]